MKKLICFMFGFVALLTFTGCSQIDKGFTEPHPCPPADITAEAAPNLYLEVIDKYITAENEKWNMEKLMENNMSTITAYCYENDTKLVYNLTDLDDDGTPELFIGTKDKSHTEKSIIDAYTIKDDQVSQIFCGSERNRYFFFQDESGTKMIANSGSGGAFTSIWSYYVLSDNQLELTQAFLFEADAEGNKSCYHNQNGSQDFTDDMKVSEDYARKIINHFSEQVDNTELDYVLLSEYPGQKN